MTQPPTKYHIKYGTINGETIYADLRTMDQDELDAYMNYAQSESLDHIIEVINEIEESRLED